MSGEHGGAGCMAHDEQELFLSLPPLADAREEHDRWPHADPDNKGVFSARPAGEDVPEHTDRSLLESLRGDFWKEPAWRAPGLLPCEPHLPTVPNMKELKQQRKKQRGCGQKLLEYNACGHLDTPLEPFAESGPLFFRHKAGSAGSARHSSPVFPQWSQAKAK